MAELEAELESERVKLSAKIVVWVWELDVAPILVDDEDIVLAVVVLFCALAPPIAARAATAAKLLTPRIVDVGKLLETKRVEVS